MLLNDVSIKELCVDDKGNALSEAMISPFSECKQIGVISYGLTHSGYDIRLGNKLLVFKNSFNRVVNPKRTKDEKYLSEIFDTVSPEPSEFGEHYVMPPHSYALGYSYEHFIIPRFLSGTCVGKSTYARSGIIINTTPLEPFWKGYLTIEIANTSPSPVMLFAMEGIAQVRFEVLNAPPKCDYEQKGGKYQNQAAAPVPGKVKE